MIARAPWLAVLVCVAGISPAVGQTQSWSADEDRVAIPFRHSLHVLLPVRVNHGPTVHFALDTGAAFPAIVSGPRLEGVELDLGETVPIGGSGTGASPTGRLVRDVTLSLGPIELAEQSAVWIPWRHLGGVFQVAEEVYMQGILGLQLLSDHVVELDFETEVLHVHRPGSFEYAGDGEVLPLSFHGNKPYVMADVTLKGGDEVPVKLHLDLGSNSTLSLIPGSHPQIVIPPGAKKAEGAGLSGNVEVLADRVQELRLGGLQLQHVPCSFYVSGHATAGDRQGLLGLGAVSRFRVILDYPRKRMILERTPSTGLPFRKNTSGAWFMPFADTFWIKRLEAGSPAHAAGLREGDVLLALDEVPGTDLRMRELVARLSGDESLPSGCGCVAARRSWRRRSCFRRVGFGAR